MNDDDDTNKNGKDAVPTAQPGKPVTGSLRSINRLMRSVGPGWVSNFRGFGYSIVVGLMTITTMGFIAAFSIINIRFAHLFALLALTPMSTTWTHAVITPLSNKSFFSRIPSIRKTYTATWLPTIALWAAMHLSVVLPELLSGLLGLNISDRDPRQGPGQVRTGPPTSGEVWKGLVVGVFALALQVLLVIPTHTAMTRVQASLLPADQDTIVPFDRSFGGRVEPEIVTGKGFATLSAALATVSRASWVRIYKLRLKMFGAAMLGYLVMGAVVAAEVLIVMSVCGSDGNKCS